jgi:hypothetical protein
MKDFKTIIDEYKANYNKHGKEKNDKYWGLTKFKIKMIKLNH